ncbi:MAG: hypothetical protein JSU91_01430 [Thermoplasmatales archaeon]|nr:MAG: hypothetical protein JSU91_01430 [Thermoplasmatales archaeon]
MKPISVLIISSSCDIASINIKNQILDISDWEEIDIFCNNPVYQHSNMKDIVIITINDRKITHENLDMEVEEKLKLKPKQAIFISRHTSKSGAPTLTTHAIGNYGDAQFGGIKKTLTKSSPKIMTELLRILKKNAKLANLYHKVCFEVTHHGPYMNIPSLFIEVGSNKEEWIKKEPANIVAKSVLSLLSAYHYEEDFKDKIPVLIGFGGGHYAPRFTDVALERKIAFGHMIPSYHIDSGNIDDEILEKTIKETPNVEGVYFHRKALKKSQLSKYKLWFQNRGIPSISSKEMPDLD